MRITLKTPEELSWDMNDNIRKEIWKSLTILRLFAGYYLQQGATFKAIRQKLVNTGAGCGGMNEILYTLEDKKHIERNGDKYFITQSGLNVLKNLEGYEK